MKFSTKHNSIKSLLQATNIFIHEINKPVMCFTFIYQKLQSEF